MCLIAVPTSCGVETFQNILFLKSNIWKNEFMNTVERLLKLFYPFPFRCCGTYVWAVLKIHFSTAKAQRKQLLKHYKIVITQRIFCPEGMCQRHGFATFGIISVFPKKTNPPSRLKSKSGHPIFKGDFLALIPLTRSSLRDLKRG